MSASGERWRVWLRGEHDGWRVVGEFATEGEALLWSNGAGLQGDLMVLPVPGDPRAPVRVNSPGPRHYRGRRLDNTGEAVRRGRAPLLRGRVF